LTVSSAYPSIRDGSAPERPHLDLSGPLLSGAFGVLIKAAEAQGGIELWIDALKLKSRMFQQALLEAEEPELDAFKGLCAFMSSVRRRVGPWLEQPAFEDMTGAIAGLLADRQDTATTDDRLAVFCERFPQDRKHRWWIRNVTR
jgi:hypothetical protein